MNSIYFSNTTAWAPSLTDDAQLWKDWVNDKAEILVAKDAPKLEYTDPLFRRRFSQITKMTIQVVHNLIEKTNVSKETKIMFISLRGEINREFTLNKSLIEDEMILPAAFSLSVFNTPISSATLAFGMKGGYEVMLPSRNDFSGALKSAIAPVLSGAEKQVIVVYADEMIPEVYNDINTSENVPLAFATIVSADKSDSAYELSKDMLNKIPSSPVKFLKMVLKAGNV